MNLKKVEMPWLGWLGAEPRLGPIKNYCLKNGKDYLVGLVISHRWTSRVLPRPEGIHRGKKKKIRGNGAIFDWFRGSL